MARQIPQVSVALLTLCLITPCGADEQKPLLAYPIPKFDTKTVFTANWIGFSPNGRSVALHYTFDQKSFLTIWNARDGKLFRTCKLDTITAFSPYGPPAHYSASGDHVLCATNEGMQLVAASTTAQDSTVNLTNRIISSNDYTYTSLRASGADRLKRVSFVSERGETWIDTFSIAGDPKVLKTSSLDTRDASCVALTPLRIAWGVPANRTTQVPLIRIRRLNDVGDLEPGEHRLKAEMPCGDLSELTFAANDKYVVAGSNDGYLRVWDLKDTKQLFTIRGGMRGVSCIDTHDVRKLVAFGSYDRGSTNIWIVSLANGKVVQSLAADPRGVYRICFSPDGQCIAAVGGSGTVSVYDISERAN